MLCNESGISGGEIYIWNEIKSIWIFNFRNIEKLSNFNLYRTSKSSKYLQTWVLLGFRSSPPIRTFIYE